MLYIESRPNTGAHLEILENTSLKASYGKKIGMDLICPLVTHTSSIKCKVSIKIEDRVRGILEKSRGSEHQDVARLRFNYVSYCVTNQRFVQFTEIKN